MRDHRTGADPAPIDITELVLTHRTKHPGSVPRADKTTNRAVAKRAKASRKANR